MDRQVFINVEFETVRQAIAIMRARVVAETGKEPTHLVCGKTIIARLSWECAPSLVGQPELFARPMQEYEGLKIVEIYGPEYYLTLGFS